MTIRLFAICLLVSCATAGRDNAAVNDGPLSTGDSPVTDAVLTSDANNCGAQPCTILPQCGCAAGATCDIDSQDLAGGQCRIVLASAKGEGEACSSFAQCLEGLVCLSGGICKKYCDANDDCQQPRGQCVIDIVNNGTPLPDVPPVCSSNCDPTNNAAAGGCPAPKKCGMFGITHNGVDTNIAECTQAGTLVQGQGCEIGATNTGDDSVCAVDFSCTTTNSTDFACRRQCLVGGTACAPLTCIQFNPTLLIAGVEYGVCN